MKDEGRNKLKSDKYGIPGHLASITTKPMVETWRKSTWQPTSVGPEGRSVDPQGEVYEVQQPGKEVTYRCTYKFVKTYK